MRVENLTYTGYPQTYVTALSSSNGTSSSYPPANGCADTGSTTYATFTSNKQEERNYFYNFNVTGISQYASITSVACSIRARTQGTGNNYMGFAQLCIGTTLKGNEVQVNTTSTGTPITLDTTDTWAVSELSNLNIRVAPNRTANNRQLRFYGAHLTINYSITYYAITTASSSQTATISASANETESGNSVTITVSVSDISTVTIKKNGTDITNQFSGSGGVYTYTYSNVNADAVFSLEDVVSSDLYIKSSGGWVKATKVFKKESNSWVEQSNMGGVFDSDNIYITII